ncbi:hypothetical protein ASPWEDRAFT_52015 [Aspergillus wentii DTO 134E9]|uniref:Uncharacterized protein n=1 Tax=Aspergillus wentii DTO 134E9 TaxID=1073089 RepID=A0A1L9RMQ6_ASPWE|nr:uncharacterized protein ASPWEDRAFT_52015 [Aspergillus wentii DTO 134E9]OJJ36192.1 hypothetical protein ASPWEDRAFT_52015 [Aspergillus wentii DTO 134E9]
MASLRFQDKVVIVTGSSSGIGRTIFWGKAIFAQSDVGEARQMGNLVQEVGREFGCLDLLVNNAGVGLEPRTPAVCHPTDESSVFLGYKYATAKMLEQPAHRSGDRGWIINMSSIMGIIAGLDNRNSLTKQVAPDYAPYKVHTATRMTPLDDLNRRHPFNGPGYSDDIARMAVVLASDDANWVTGVCLPVDGGCTAR